MLQNSKRPRLRIMNDVHLKKLHLIKKRKLHEVLLYLKNTVNIEGEKISVLRRKNQNFNPASSYFS